jgi:CRISPR-associated protein Csx10
MSASFNVTIEFLSDWAIGSGAGRQGSIDRLIERDPDGLPYVPATTLRGLWRDAAEQLAFGLDEGKGKGPWSKLVPQLFGSEPAVEALAEDKTSDVPVFEQPVRSRLSVDDLRFPKLEAEYLAHKKSQALRRALVFLKPGVAIDPGTGAAMPDFLRFEEMARKGIALEGKARIDCDCVGEPERLKVFALAALKLIDRLGNKRRRGAGKCKVTTPGTAPNFTLLNGDPPEVPPLEPERPTPSYKTSKSGGWQRFRLEITLKTPTLIADEVQGNLITGLDYIPGTLLVPVAAKLLEECGLDLLAGFASGYIRVLPAYPAIGDERSLPVPASWADILNDPKAFKRLQRDYTYFDGKVLSLTRPETVVRTHNTVDNRAQKPTEAAGGGVFVYEALKPGQRFFSELWVRGPIAQEPKSEDAASLGRARNAGYGQIKIECKPIKNQELPGLTASFDGPRLLLLSDLLLPATPAQSVASALEKLCGHIGPVDVKGSRLNLRRHEGWVAAWGLPRPSLVAIAAGSVIMLEAAKTLTDPFLGSRNGEGFGHVALDHELTDPRVIEAKTIESAKSVKSYREDEAKDRGDWPGLPELIELLEREAGKRAAEEWAELVAANKDKRRDLFGWSDTQPSMSQIGALRAVAGTLPSDNERKSAISYLTAQKAKQKEPDKSWQNVALGTFNKFAVGEDVTLKFARNPGELREKLKLHALAALFHAAIRYHKRAIEKGAADG